MKKNIIFIGIILVSLFLFGCESLQNKETSNNSLNENNSNDNLNNKGNIGVIVSSLSKADLTKYSKTRELKLSSQVNAEFIIETDHNLKSLKIQSISYDGINCIIEEVLYEEESFIPKTALIISAYIPSSYSNLLISYIDKNGKSINYFVNSNLNNSDEVVVLVDANEVINK